MWREATNFISMLNILDKGRAGTIAECKRVVGPPPTASPGRQLAQERVFAVALREATRLVRARRCLGTTGAQAVSTLLKSEQLDSYGLRFARKEKHVELKADLIDEPAHTRTVNMLEALPAEEAAYYAQEHHVADPAGKSQRLFNEIEEQYGFWGGSLQEYLAYFRRPDLPSNLWKWTLEEDVKAVAGFSVVLKKSGRHRKLLMQCASNYMWEDVRERANHGLLGGAALASVHIPEDAMEAAGFDEGNAFTSVEVPDWMTHWVCAPPVRAALVPTKIRERLRPGNWTFPRYTRLAMGSSHNVHIIMSINITVIGRSSVASRRFGTFDHEGTAEDESDEGEGVDLSDLAWQEKQRLRREHVVATVPLAAPTAFPASGSFLSVEHWLQVVRDLRHSATRVFVVLHVFGGERREGDVEYLALRMAQESHLRLFFTTVDLATDPDWDIAAPAPSTDCPRLLKKAWSTLSWAAHRARRGQARASCRHLGRVLYAPGASTPGACLASLQPSRSVWTRPTCSPSTALP